MPMCGHAPLVAAEVLVRKCAHAGRQHVRHRFKSAAKMGMSHCEIHNAIVKCTDGGGLGSRRPADTQ